MMRLADIFQGTCFFRAKPTVPTVLANRMATRLVPLAMSAPRRGTRMIRVTAEPPPAMTLMKPAENPASTSSTPVNRSSSAVKFPWT